jgi:hypothetical protein
MTDQELETLHDLYLLFEDVCAHACVEYDVPSSQVYLAMKAFAYSKEDDLNNLRKLLDS